MFGHQDDETKQQNNDEAKVANSDAAAPAPAPESDQAAETDTANEPNVVSPSPEPSPLADSSVNSDTPVTEPMPDTPSLSLSDTSDDSEANDQNQIRDVLSPAGGYPKTPSSKVQPGGFTSSTDDDDQVIDLGNGQLVDIKKHALEELLPLIDKLEQTPEERFRTLMMLIQATDKQELLESAYEAAHKIEDEKLKAQALLDVVNEINYFTQAPTV